MKKQTKSTSKQVGVVTHYFDKLHTAKESPAVFEEFSPSDGISIS